MRFTALKTREPDRSERVVHASPQLDRRDAQVLRPERDVLLGHRADDLVVRVLLDESHT